MSSQTIFVRPRLPLLVLCIILYGFVLIFWTHLTPLADPFGMHRAATTYQTELFGKKYRLDDSEGLSKYIKALETEIERSKKEEPAGEAHRKDPLHYKEPRNFVEKKLRHSMEEAHAVALELFTASGDARERLLKDLTIMAGAIRASFLRPLPGNMDALVALSKEKDLRHP